jgi:hypothetical protein
MYKKAEKIDDSTGKYTFQYNVYLDLKRLKNTILKGGLTNEKTKIVN